MAKEPFAMHPSCENFFEASSHDTALTLIKESIREGEPYILVTGEYGIGKTLLCMQTCRFLRQQKNLANVHVSSPATPYSILLTSVFGELKLGRLIKTCTTISALEATLFKLYLTGKIVTPVCIVLDDLQDYRLEMLERFKKLMNFHVDSFYPFRFICFSHPGFIKKLSRDDSFIPFVQRFRRRVSLEPLTAEELKEYIYYRLLHAGARGRPLFGDGALSVISERSGGIPRIVNSICDQLLLRAVQLGVYRIDTVMAEEVCDNFLPEPAGYNEDDAAGGSLRARPGSREPKQDAGGISLVSVIESGKAEKEESRKKERDALRPQYPPLLLGLLGGAIIALLLILVWLNLDKPESPGAVGQNEKKIQRIQQNLSSAEGTSVNGTGGDLKIEEAYSAMDVGKLLAPPWEKPYSFVVFDHSSPAEIDRSLRSEELNGVQVIVSEVQEEGGGVVWTVYAGRFSSKEEAAASPLHRRFGQNVVYAPFSLLVKTSRDRNNIDEQLRVLQEDGYYPWTDLLPNGKIRLLIGAYTDKQSAFERLQVLQQEGVAAVVVRR